MDWVIGRMMRAVIDWMEILGYAYFLRLFPWILWELTKDLLLSRRLRNGLGPCGPVQRPVSAGSSAPRP